MKNWLYVINNFAHDFFTGLWFGAVSLMFVVDLQYGRKLLYNQVTIDLLHDLTRLLLTISVISLFFVLLSGLLRFLYRHEWDLVEKTAKNKKQMLIIKHIILGTIFLAGSIYSFFFM